MESARGQEIGVNGFAAWGFLGRRFLARCFVGGWAAIALLASAWADDTVAYFNYSKYVRPEASAVCWRHSEPKNALGTPPTSCSGGQHDSDGLCYKACPSGYKGVGPVCWRTCQSGFTDLGVACVKPLAPWDGKWGQAKCDSSYSAADLGMSCLKKTTTRGAGTIPTQCSSGQTNYGGLCYPDCGAGHTRIGPACIALNCPTTHPKACGDLTNPLTYSAVGLCGMTSDACTNALVDQYANVIDYGMGRVYETLKAAKAGSTGNLAIAIRSMLTDLRRQFNDLLGSKTVAEVRRIITAFLIKQGADYALTSVDAMVAFVVKGDMEETELDSYVQLIYQAAIASNGLLGLADAFAKPMCDYDPPSAADEAAVWATREAENAAADARRVAKLAELKAMVLTEALPKFSPLPVNVATQVSHLQFGLTYDTTHYDLVGYSNLVTSLRDLKRRDEVFHYSYVDSFGKPSVVTDTTWHFDDWLGRRRSYLMHPSMDGFIDVHDRTNTKISVAYILVPRDDLKTVHYYEVRPLAKAAGEDNALKFLATRRSEQDIQAVAGNANQLTLRVGSTTGLDAVTTASGAVHLPDVIHTLTFAPAYSASTSALFSPTKQQWDNQTAVPYLNSQGLRRWLVIRDGAFKFLDAAGNPLCKVTGSNLAPTDERYWRWELNGGKQNNTTYPWEETLAANNRQPANLPLIAVEGTRGLWTSVVYSGGKPQRFYLYEHAPGGIKDTRPLPTLPVGNLSCSTTQ